MAKNDENVVDAEVVEGEVDMTTEMSALSAIDTVTRAEIDMQIATAHRFPRSIATVKREIVDMATLDQETAELCFYSLKRSGKVIQGPSIRLAEIALSAYGNVRAGTRVLGETEDGRFVRVLGVCHDLQKNVAVAQEVTRRITTKDGKRFGDDMIGTTLAAASSIALRNSAFRVIPLALVKPAFEKAKLVAAGDVKALSQKRQEVLDRLCKAYPTLSVEKLLAWCEVATVEEITGEMVTLLIGLGTGLKDGTTTLEAEFPDGPTKAPAPDMTEQKAKLEAVKPAGEEPKKASPKPPETAGDPKAKIGVDAALALKEAAKAKGLPPKALQERTMEKWGVEFVSDLTGEQAKELEAYIVGWTPGA